MDYTTIRGVSRACDAARAAMLNKGFVTPDVNYWIMPEGDGHIYVSHAKEGPQLPASFNAHSQGMRRNPEAAFGALSAAIASCSTVEQIRRRALIKAIAAAVELGEVVSLDMATVIDSAQAEAHENLMRSLRDVLESSSHLLGVDPPQGEF